MPTNSQEPRSSLTRSVDPGDHDTAPHRPESVKILKQIMPKLSRSKNQFFNRTASIFMKLSDSHFVVIELIGVPSEDPFDLKIVACDIGGIGGGGSANRCAEFEVGSHCSYNFMIV